MSKIYIAGPLFCESERSYNIVLRDALRSAGHDPVLPQDIPLDIDPESMSDPQHRNEVSREVFMRDIGLLDSCDTILINLDGRVPDEGACIELGYAYARGKRCLAIKTDVRVAEYGGDNMMISGIVGDNVATDIPSLIAMLS